MTRNGKSIRVSISFAANIASRNRTLTIVGAAVAGSFAASGCGEAKLDRVSTFPVSGTISFRGQPANGAFVMLSPKATSATNAPTPRASVGPDGSFTFTTYEGGDGAPEGEYVLTAMWTKPVKVGGEFVSGPNILPRKYARPETSDLKFEVTAQESNVLPPIQLK